MTRAHLKVPSLSRPPCSLVPSRLLFFRPCLLVEPLLHPRRERCLQRRSGNFPLDPLDLQLFFWNLFFTERFSGRGILFPLFSYPSRFPGVFSLLSPPPPFFLASSGMSRHASPMPQPYSKLTNFFTGRLGPFFFPRVFSVVFPPPLARSLPARRFCVP